MRNLGCLLLLAGVFGCASTNHTKSELRSRMPASTQGANWLARVCRSKTDNSVKSIQYVETVSTTATSEQLETLNSTLSFVETQPTISDNYTAACTCDAVAIQSDSKIYVNRAIYKTMPEADRGKLMNDMAMGIGVPADQVKTWCESKLRIPGN